MVRKNLQIFSKFYALATSSNIDRFSIKKSKHILYSAVCRKQLRVRINFGNMFVIDAEDKNQNHWRLELPQAFKIKRSMPLLKPYLALSLFTVKGIEKSTLLYIKERLED